MLWIELTVHGSPDSDELDAIVFQDDQTTIAGGTVLTPQQDTRLDEIMAAAVDESVCEAVECCSKMPAGIGMVLIEDDDEPWRSGVRLRPFFLTTDGKALCEDCGVELLEKMQVIIPG